MFVHTVITTHNMRETYMTTLRVHYGFLSTTYTYLLNKFFISIMENTTDIATYSSYVCVLLCSYKAESIINKETLNYHNYR